MHGHDILFDAENGRIGFAESSCVYKEELSVHPSTKNDKANDFFIRRDCDFSELTLVSECWESIDINDCVEKPLSAIVNGLSTYTALTQSTSCKPYAETLLNEVVAA